MTSPISTIASFTIGTVESVSPDEIKVLLDIDAPRNTALNTGVPTSFPRINSYVLLPNEYGAVVGTVIWLGVEKSSYPKRQGLKDFGLIDLPFPLRKMTVCPIGTLLQNKNEWRLVRGVQCFPSVGDSVILPTRTQSMAIVTGKDEDCRVPLGTCPTAFDAPVAIDPDKMFGRHLAVLGNTGSGKSCSLAVLVRSAIESAQKAMPRECEIQPQDIQTKPNARFIILDPNGEYSKCFQDLEAGCRVFHVPALAQSNINEFTLPAWMWNSSEWAAVTQAAPRSQRPLLQEALRNLRLKRPKSPTMENRLLARCKSLKVFLAQFAGKGTIGFPQNTNCGQQLNRFIEDINSYTLSNKFKEEVNNVILIISEIIENRAWRNGSKSGFNDFGDTDIIKIDTSVEQIINLFPEEDNSISINEDTPIDFNPQLLAEYIEALALQEGASIAQFISTLTLRIKGIMSDQRMAGVINPQTPITLSDWLTKHIGGDGGTTGAIAVLDLSLVPYEILHLVIAISSRLILEAQQRYRKLNNENLPTVLVLEEAHTFVSKRSPRSEEIPSPADMCREIFERIAREGRKFGLGLVLSSQRPSELSETVLSQCNSFILHRITNDRDQELISRLVPDNARGLLRELPSLPTSHCILLGSASKVPTMVEVTHLQKEQSPESDNPDFWDVWTHQKSRPIDWQAIVDDWTGGTIESEEPPENFF